MWFPTQCWEKQGRHELPWMLFALYPYSPVHTCIPWVNPSWFSCCAQGGEGREGKESPGRSGGTARHYRLPKQQQALLNPMCNNPATTVPGLFPEQKLVCAMWFGGFSVWFLGGWGKMYLTRPSPHPLSIQAEVKGWHRPGTKSPLSSFTCLNLSVLVASQALSRTRLLGLFHWWKGKAL